MIDFMDFINDNSGFLENNSNYEVCRTTESCNAAGSCGYASDCTTYKMKYEGSEPVFEYFDYCYGSKKGAMSGLDSGYPCSGDIIKLDLESLTAEKTDIDGSFKDTKVYRIDEEKSYFSQENDELVLYTTLMNGDIIDPSEKLSLNIKKQTSWFDSFLKWLGIK